MMIILIILTICAIAVAHLDAEYEGTIFYLGGLGAIGLGILDVIVVISIILLFANGITAKPKIEMYEKENQKIEEQVDVLVKQYMEYEGKTLKEFKSENSITLVSLYPELKSDTLISKQIEVYIANNNKIKELKEKEIEMKIGKWLLYFGK